MLIATFSLFANQFPTINRTLGMVETYDYNSPKIRNSEKLGWGNIPDSIMVFLVEFEDVKFDREPDFPDYIAHDDAYFHRLMFHLDSYYSDASHGNYEIITDNDSLYQFYPEIITLPKTMAYYGEEGKNRDLIEKKVEIIVDLIDLIDPYLDFSNYDSFILFHAGAGQEGNPDNTELIQSTFLSRKSFQAGLDPENDDFPGILTDDETYFKEITILPESENKANLEEGSPILGMLGVFAQAFGYQLGLPTLYDNNTSNGLSFGIGSFGVMGYGLWNAAGYVPPLPCAWSRYYMGWETNNIYNVTTTEENLEIAYPSASTENIPTLYKIDISQKEYFLLENRQQNPDKSFFVNTSGDTLVTFSFEIVDDQEYYEPGHPYAGQPEFSFMKNTYKGCEWDFYLPGFGYGDAPENDGSGILIWHIDENIIETNFLQGYETNSVNADGTHKGIDLEEADGIQHLDGPYNPWYLGSPDDSYREGNNTYFGKMYTDSGALSLPTSESYYGGSQMEISDISISDTLMTFSVDFQWFLDSGYIGENIYNAAVIDLDSDGEEEIFYPMPNGEVYLWKNFNLAPNFPITLDSIPYYYAFDDETNTFIVPTFNATSNLTRIMFIGLNSIESHFFLNKTWAANPIVNPDADSPYRVILPLNADDNSIEIILLDSDYAVINSIQYDNETIISNLILKNEILSLFTSDTESNTVVREIDLNDLDNQVQLNYLDISAESILSVHKANLDSDNPDEFVITTSDSLIYVYNHLFESMEGFPFKTDSAIKSLPSFADIDGNGLLDILLGEENQFTVIEQMGNFNKPEETIESPDSLNISAGCIAINLDNDTDLEVIGNISRNRLVGWKNINNNDFQIIRGFSFTSSELSRNFPILYNGSAGSKIYIAADNGTIFHQEWPSMLESNWSHEYGNLQRTASYLASKPTNNFDTDELFIEKNTYLFPNPLNTVFNSSVFNGTNREMTITLKVMTSRDVNVNVKIFDIAGNLIKNNDIYCLAYIQSSLFIDAAKLSSGIYFAVIKSEGRVLKKKFAVEK